MSYDNNDIKILANNIKEATPTDLTSAMSELQICVRHSENYDAEGNEAMLFGFYGDEEIEVSLDDDPAKTMAKGLLELFERSNSECSTPWDLKHEFVSALRVRIPHA